MKACTLHPFPGRPKWVRALSWSLVGCVGRGPVAPSPPGCCIHPVLFRVQFLEEGMALVAKSCDFGVLPGRATRGPHGWPDNRLLMSEQGRNCANSDSPEGVSLLGEERG